MRVTQVSHQARSFRRFPRLPQGSPSCHCRAPERSSSPRPRRSRLVGRWWLLGGLWGGMAGAAGWPEPWGWGGPPLLPAVEPENPQKEKPVRFFQETKTSGSTTHSSVSGGGQKCREVRVEKGPAAMLLRPEHSPCQSVLPHRPRATSGPPGGGSSRVKPGNVFHSLLKHFLLGLTLPCLLKFVVLVHYGF